MTGTLDKNYLLTYKSGNIFGITSGKSGLVSVKAKSVTLVDKSKLFFSNINKKMEKIISFLHVIGY